MSVLDDTRRALSELARAREHVKYLNEDIDQLQRLLLSALAHERECLAKCRDALALAGEELAS